MADRVSGTGGFVFYPNEGTNGITVTDGESAVIALLRGGYLKYKQGTAGDDWDIYSMGYWIQGRLKPNY